MDNEEKMGVDDEKYLIPKLGRYYDRLNQLMALDETSVMAILALHRDGVSFETIQEAWGIPTTALNLIIADADAMEKEDEA